MRIALVHMRHAPTGGTEGFLSRLARHLAERGHAVTVVCRSHTEAPHPRVRFLVLRPLSIGSAWRTWSFARAVERELAKRPAFDAVYGLGRTWTQDALRLGGGCHATLLERVLRSSPSLADRIEARVRPRHRVVLAIEERALRATPLVVANSRMVARDVAARYGLADERLRVVHNGVDPGRFHPRRREEGGARVRREAGVEGAGPVLLFLGSSYHRKGLDHLLRALPPLLARRPDARLLVAGRDSSRPRYEALARRLGVARAVRFLGLRTDAPDCFAAADLFVLPTRYDAFANATVESLASGVPTITTDSNGGAEVVEPGVHGEVLPLDAIDRALPEALLAWSDPDRLRAAGAAARARGEECSAERELAATEAILAEAAAARGTPG